MLIKKLLTFLSILAICPIVLADDFKHENLDFNNTKNLPLQYYLLEDIDNYKDTSKQIKPDIVEIPKNRQKQFKKDMNKAIKHVLYDNITYENNTFKQLLLDYEKEADKIYQKYLSNPNNQTQNVNLYKELHKMNATISLYPEAIFDEISWVVDKYKLNLVAGSQIDIYIHKNYIEKYNIKLAKEFKELLKLKISVYNKIQKYEYQMAL